MSVATIASKKRKIGKGVPFYRIRRITGYLVGTVDRWNDAKKKELGDRTTHNIFGQQS